MSTDIHETKSVDYNSLLTDIQHQIDSIPTSQSVGELSDRYHTFNELYDHRAKLFIALCRTSFKNIAWKSLLHDDGTMFPGMFIVGVETKYGQATYHYDINPYWAMFKGIKELDKAPKWDGHTPNEAIERIYKHAVDMTTTTTRDYTVPTPDIFGGISSITTCGNGGAGNGSPFNGDGNVTIATPRTPFDGTITTAADLIPDVNLGE